MIESNDLFYWQVPVTKNAISTSEQRRAQSRIPKTMEFNLAKAREAWLDEETTEERLRRYKRGIEAP